jgi:hypothetical protein
MAHTINHNSVLSDTSRTSTSAARPARSHSDRGVPHRASRGAHFEKDLPYSVDRAGILEVLRMVDGEAELDEYMLDSAWLGLERPSPEVRDARRQVLVWMTKTQSEALRGLIDGDDVKITSVNGAAGKLRRLQG